MRALLADPRVDPAFRGNIALAAAAVNGHSAAVECLVSDVRVDAFARNGQALRLASAIGNLPIVTLLLGDGRTLSPSNMSAAVRAACAGQHVEVLRRLLADRRVSVREIEAFEALRCAIKFENLQMLDLLLADGRIMHSQEMWRQRALNAACAVGNLALLERLLLLPAIDPSSGRDSALVEASARGHLPVVNRLLQDGRVNAVLGAHPGFAEAAAAGHLQVVEGMLTAARNPASPAVGRTALPAAAAAGFPLVVQRLLADARTLSVDVNMALSRAASVGHLAVVTLLLSDARVTAEGLSTALMEASCGGDAKVLECLLADPRCPISHHQATVEAGCQPMFSLGAECLQHACEYGSATVVHCLLADARIDATVKRALGECFRIGIKAARPCIVECFAADWMTDREAGECVAQSRLRCHTAPEAPDGAIGAALLRLRLAAADAFSKFNFLDSLTGLDRDPKLTRFIDVAQAGDADAVRRYLADSTFDVQQHKLGKCTSALEAAAAVAKSEVVRLLLEDPCWEP